MYTLNGWWFLSSSGSYPPVFMVDVEVSFHQLECVFFELLVPPLFIEGNSHSYNSSIFVFAGATVPY